MLNCFIAQDLKAALHLIVPSWLVNDNDILFPFPSILTLRSICIIRLCSGVSQRTRWLIFPRCFADILMVLQQMWFTFDAHDFSAVWELFVVSNLRCQWNYSTEETERYRWKQPSHFMKQRLRQKHPAVFGNDTEPFLKRGINSSSVVLKVNVSVKAEHQGFSVSAGDVSLLQ